MEDNSKATTRENDALSSALSGILGNPEMMSMISSMAEQLKGGSAPSADQSSKKEDEAPSKADESIPASSELSGVLGALAPLLSQSLGKLSREDDSRACLLRALKPYLSQNRCEAIEHIIKFSKISDVIKNLS